MKKVCIIAQFPFEYLEGIEGGRGAGQQATWLPQLALAWRDQQDFEIHWIILGFKQSAERVIKKFGQTFYLVPSPGISASLLLLRWPQKILFAKYFKSIQPDLIHCWGTESLNDAALQSFDGPSILSMQGIISAYYPIGDLKGWRWKLFRHWEPVSIKRATIVTCESQWGIEKVQEANPGKETYKIEYGVHPSYYEVAWQPDPEKPRFLYVGGLNRLKGVDILIETIKRHPKRNWKLAFVGSGYFEDELLKLNDPKIEILGILKTADLQKEMSKSWALVHPARADTSPNVVKEARVMGLPVVGSPNGGHSEYIENGIDGFIINSEDPVAWCKSLDFMSENYVRCKQMGSVNHEKYRKHFLPENTAASFSALYQQILSSKL